MSKKTTISKVKNLSTSFNGQVSRLTDELGATGLLRTGPTHAVIYEEFLRELSGIRARLIYREMRDNDAVIGAMFFAIEMLARNIQWRVEGDDQESNDFIESCMDDMSHTWEDFIAEIFSMLTFGFSWHEIVYKKRLGPGDDPSKRSKYDDGKIGWRKIPIRAQESLIEWTFDEEGGIQSFIQSAAPLFKRVEIPINRSLLFRVGIHKGNPEGRSLLRNAYRSWFIKKRIEEIEAIGVERDLAGIPTIYRTAEVAAKYDAELKMILRNVRRDEQEGLLLPLAYDELGNKLLTFELLASGSKRQLDVSAIIERYSKTIAMTVLADFILMGQTAVGSFALSDNKTELFASAIGAILKAIAAVLNRVAIPRLLALNGVDPKIEVTLVPGDLETPDLIKLGSYITALAGAGAPLFPDDDLENHLREVADLPKKAEDSKAVPSTGPNKPTDAIHQPDDSNGTPDAEPQAPDQDAADAAVEDATEKPKQQNTPKATP